MYAPSSLPSVLDFVDVGPKQYLRVLVQFLGGETSEPARSAMIARDHF